MSLVTSYTIDTKKAGKKAVSGQLPPGYLPPISWARIRITVRVRVRIRIRVKVRVRVGVELDPRLGGFDRMCPGVSVLEPKKYTKKGIGFEIDTKRLFYV